MIGLRSSKSYELICRKCHVSLVDADAAANMEVDVVKAGGTVLKKDYLVDQRPPQYHHDLTPARQFYSDPGVPSSSAPPPPLITRRYLEEYFQCLQMDFFVPIL
ncbi:hypothetical protein F0562_032167 [Nyssa sinensis]|uniref:Uncharacterized protein n=1 Tax=Nyssa sinensis TaxID=561372 RepID=A0A5J5AW44_9ASTE|nr:hypothetical protein F0562_032167 [Nyssa sinensis]